MKAGTRQQEQSAEFLRTSQRRLYFKDPESGPGLLDYKPATFDGANLVSSMLLNCKHAPLLDLDVPHRVVPSSTEGHSHLYIDVQMPWWRYRLLLWLLQFTGIIGKGYYKAAVLRKQSMVRMPGVSKTDTKSWCENASSAWFGPS